MQIRNIASYKFVELTELTELQTQLRERCHGLGLKGTILIGGEGINFNLAGNDEDITTFLAWLTQDARFVDLTCRESISDFMPFRRMRVRIKKEIITLRREKIHPEKCAAPNLTPAEFKQWLDENRDITVLDTRNDYEVKFGTFRGALNLKIDDFGQFPAASAAVPRDKPIVMFCTGGIRCEKAALELLNAGYEDVRQLQGGILNYFTEVGGAHYEGDCFVFDQRVALDASLKTTGIQQCKQCHGPKSAIAAMDCANCRIN